MPTLYQLLSGGMTREEHREKVMIHIAKKRAQAKAEKPDFGIHEGLDLLGMTPGVGIGADLLNAALYASKGRKGRALSSLVSAVPIAGQGATLKRMAEVGDIGYGGD
tara:strand:- start:58 stop:378 length:321 start_codon:yes stop_codon:yes gene_type:complete